MCPWVLKSVVKTKLYSYSEIWEASYKFPFSNFESNFKIVGPSGMTRVWSSLISFVRENFGRRLNCSYSSSELKSRMLIGKISCVLTTKLGPKAPKCFYS